MKNENVMDEKRKREIKALLQDMEAIVEKKRKTKPFNPLPHFTLHKVLSEVVPQFYTKQELTQIEVIAKMKRSTLEGEKNVNEEERVKPETK
ncbi:hypothetical protein QL285_043621 [Trifolium repens]|jgi:hypothetical protein|nr:hypothetical protein QL285_043621 [Trifolium repens]